VQVTAAEEVCCLLLSLALRGTAWRAFKGVRCMLRKWQFTDEGCANMFMQNVSFGSPEAWANACKQR